MEAFIVYLHFKPGTESVFYVGKGKPGREKSFKGRNLHWWNTVSKYGGFETLVFESGLSESAAFEIERSLIRHFGRKDYEGGTLVNKTLGGEGSAGFGLFGEKNGRFGKKVPIDVAKTFGRCQKGKLNPMNGKKHSKTTKEAISKKALERYSGGFKNPMLGKSRPEAAELGRQFSKKLAQFTIDGVLVAEHESVSSAARNTGLMAGNISSACNGRLKTCGGYKWQFING
jgi:hypothetical protein